MNLWTKRKFWDGTEAIFLKNHSGMSCYDLDSDELGDIILRKKNELNAQMDEWGKLQGIREEYINGKKSNRSI
jgi:hypothetical protein